jgi:hypothetical protein
MTTPVVPSAAGMPTDKSRTPARRTYRTTTSFVAVHFDQAGKGRIMFLPYGATFQVIRPSSCLPAGFEVMFEQQHYNVFEIDVLVRSTPICETIHAKRRAAAA